MPAGRSYQIGRDRRCAIVIDDTGISRHHAVLATEGGRWVLVDDGSANGTYVDGRRIRRIEIRGVIVARLGHPTDGLVLTCAVAGAREKPGEPSHPDPADVAEGTAPGVPARRPRAEPPGVPPPGGTLRIGRSRDNDIVVPDPGVSRHHAELRGAAGGYRIVDLASSNGTFVNHQRVTDVPLSEGDVVAFGSARFRLVRQKLQRITGTGAAVPASDPAPRPRTSRPGWSP